MRKDAPIISCFDLRTHQDGGGLDSVSIDVSRGAWVEVVGPARCGKSTLFSVMSLRARPESGKLVIGGRNFDRIRGNGVAEVRRMFGSCGERPLFLEDRSVIENLAVPFVVRGEPRIALERCEELLEQTDLLSIRDQPVSALSLQERLAVGVLRAAAGAPKAVLIDGVLEQLDLALRKQLMEVLRSVHLKGSAVVLFGRAFSENARRGRRHRLENGQLLEVEVPTLVDAVEEGVA